MHKTQLLIPAAALAVLGLASCSNSSDTARRDTSIEFETLSRHEVYRLDNTAKTFMTDNDICYEDSAVIIMPKKVYGNDISGLRDSIISAAFDTVAPFGDAADACFRKVIGESGYTATLANDSTPRNDADGLSLINGDVFSMSSSLLTYRVSTYQYFPGAAHGLTVTKYITYDMDGGRIITLSDLFTAEGLAKLPAMIRERAVQLAPAIGPTDITALPAMGTFYISLDDAVVFVYQPYEVASYAQGAIAISFYPYQLTELLTPAGAKLFGLE